MNLKDRLKGSLVYGAIGDAIGNRYEGLKSIETVDFDFEWKISDDTQLTLATCEALIESDSIDPEKIATKFLLWYNQGKLSGLGASTLKALRELQMGGHWTQVGRTGEFAAGNGAAMRIAPLAFKNNVDHFNILDVCKITHKNDEAYAGALAIYYAIKYNINAHLHTHQNSLRIIANELPDTKMRDRLLELTNCEHMSIYEVGKLYKPSGYVVDSVPIAIFAAQQIEQLDFKTILTELIKIGGDTDTICSMAGQIIGATKGSIEISKAWELRYMHLNIDELVNRICDHWKQS